MKGEIPNLTEDWWRPDQIELANDTSKTWELKRFRNVPGFWTIIGGQRILGKLSEHTELPPDSIVNNRAWDHEHCYLCFETISEYENAKNEGYTNGKNWLCIECHEKYILPRLNNQI